MSFTAVSLAWAFLQITVLCGVSLTLAWMLRGRRPQFASALLTGACVASVVLALVAMMPLCQWTFAIPEQIAKTESSLITNSLPTTSTGSKSNSIDMSTQNPQSMDESIEGSSDRMRQTSGLEALRNLISPYLHRMDREIRDAEAWQKPVQETRNVSMTLLALLGLGLMSLLWCSSWLAMRHILHQSTPVEDNDLLGLVAEQAKAFQLKRLPAVRESILIPIGATVGWRNVTVLVHTDWREWSDDEKRAVVAHELAHAARQDFAWVMLSSWTRIVLFFHPVVHALIHRLRLEQELAADQLAAGKLGNAKAYGRALASLALRSQRTGRTSNAEFGSMLSAGQICVTRRVMMLKQGSLKPIPFQSRWSVWAVAAIACSAIPLAGLRGTTQEPISETAPAKEASLNADAGKGLRPSSLSKEFRLAHPALRFPGVTALKPSRLRSGEFGPEVAWLLEYYTTMVMGQPLPDKATVYGECNIHIDWHDETRAHGQLSVEASVKNADQALAGQLKRLNDYQTSLDGYDAFPNGYTPKVLSEEKANGRTIAGIATRPFFTSPNKWVVDDEQGFFCGTLEEARRYANGERSETDSIPEALRKEFSESAAAFVFPDCEPWFATIEAFAKGSAKESEFRMFTSQLEGVRCIGLFVDGYNAPACKLKAIALNEQSAARVATKITMLLEMGKLALSAGLPESDVATTEILKSMLETAKIETSGTEVSLTFDIFAPSLRSHQLISCFQTEGWINLGLSSTALASEALAESDSTKSINATVNGSPVKTGATLTPQGTTQTMPNLFGQTLDATSYRGKTVRFSVDVQCDEGYENQAGVFVLASRQESVVPLVGPERVPMAKSSPYVAHRTLAAVSSAADGRSAFSEAIQAKRQEAFVEPSTSATWKQLYVQFEVPNDAEHISFGCYTKIAKLHVRDARFWIVDGTETDSTAALPSKLATSDIPYNMMLVPGYEIQREPTNLDFVKSTIETVWEAARASNQQSR
jgi:beta-lactamase regulating signal transducer with metallopeptidase domain